VFRLLRVKVAICGVSQEGELLSRGRQQHTPSDRPVSATLTVVGTVIAYKLTESLDRSQSLRFVLAWILAGIIVTYLVSRVQARSQEESPEAIKERVSQLEPELRKQVQARSYGARSKLIEAPLKELALDITPRVGWVRDPRLVEPEPLSEKIADDIVAAFESSKRRLLIVGEPGSGKSMAAYSLIQYLDETEGAAAGRIPLLVNLSAWEAQDSIEAFLVDYLCSTVGYEVRQRAVANAFISSRRYTLILDGLDEIPPGLRTHFSERLDEFVQGLPSEVGAVVTCRTQEYEVLLAAHPTGLGLVQAVEMLPLTDQQLDSALAELAKVDEDWEVFLRQKHLPASQRARHVLSNPLFLNLAVVGPLRPRQLLECDEEQSPRDLVLDGYLDRTLANQSQYNPADARRYLAWIARFLNRAEVSPFGLKTSDATVFDLANLTPPEPPRGYRLAVGLIGGLIGGLILGWDGGLVVGLFLGLPLGLAVGLVWELVGALPSRWTHKRSRSAFSSRMTFVWQSTRQRRHVFLREAGRGLIVGLIFGSPFALIFVLIVGLSVGLGAGEALLLLLVVGLIFGLPVGLIRGLIGGLVETRPVLITSRTPTEASSRSVITALVFGSVLCLSTTLVFGLFMSSGLRMGLSSGLCLGLIVGLVGGLNNGGWFVLLQKIAHRHLARAGNLPPRPHDFLEWGIGTQIFRRVGGGVRFRHNLIQQHLVNFGGKPPHLGGKPPHPRQLSLLRRTFLLYNPHTRSGWILHTLFYMFGLVFVTWSLFAIVGASPGGYSASDMGVWALIATPLVIVLLIIRHLARRNAAQLEETAS